MRGLNIYVENKKRRRGKEEVLMSQDQFQHASMDFFFARTLLGEIIRVVVPRAGAL